MEIACSVPIDFSSWAGDARSTFHLGCPGHETCSPCECASRVLSSQPGLKSLVARVRWFSWIRSPLMSYRIHVLFAVDFSSWSHLILNSARHGLVRVQSPAPNLKVSLFGFSLRDFCPRCCSIYFSSCSDFSRAVTKSARAVNLLTASLAGLRFPL
jgi:hypothetical protein